MRLAKGRLKLELDRRINNLEIHYKSRRKMIAHLEEQSDQIRRQVDKMQKHLDDLSGLDDSAVLAILDTLTRSPASTK